MVGTLIPVLYSADDTDFDNNGIGMLSDTISCSVIEELNGQFELTLKYPLDGIHAEYLDYRNIILATPNPVSEAQPFRIYRLVPTSAGTMTAYARHIVYDLQAIPVKPYGSSTSVATAFNALKNNTAVTCPFTLKTDKGTAGTFSVDVPKPLWRCLGGAEGSILDVYGGEYEFDRFSVNLWNRRGEDRGVSIRYGKNLKTLEQDKNCAECYTGVYPYWADTEGNLVELPEKIIHADGNYGYVSILTLDLSQEWQDAPTENQLRTRARNYMTSNAIGVPTVSWRIEFVRLEQTIEYQGYQVLEQVLIGDGINVYFPKMRVDATARVVAVEYDPIAERYISVTLGSVKSNMASTIAHQQSEIQRKPSVTLMQAIIMTLTSRILGAKGGAVRLLDTDNDGMPDTLYVADKADPEHAKKVWRWNYEGWAGSLNGYNGPFTVGATLEDGLLATAVTAANLVAGTIQSADDGKTFFLDLDNGILKMNATELTIAGKTLQTMITDKMTQQEIFDALTNGGQDQGIHLKDGKIYINAEYLMAGRIYSSKITLNGLFEVRADPNTTWSDYLGGYLGYMSGIWGNSGIVSDGVAIYNVAKDCYVIVTEAGVRLQAGKNNLYLTPDGSGIVVEGDLTVTGKIQYGGSLEVLSE